MGRRATPGLLVIDEPTDPEAQQIESAFRAALEGFDRLRHLRGRFLDGMIENDRRQGPAGVRGDPARGPDDRELMPGISTEVTQAPS